ncbi:MAG TPA: MgtC/SapB family protein [Chloroflexota bacterium]|nr:MgtC/SapB family protein [Chloroflexota bacterium]
MVDLARLLELELIGRVLVAFALGAVIGFERERRAKVAGLRTHMLVAGGSALFTVASYSIFGGVSEAWDPSRVAAQIVSGIGFLGAGAIIQSGGSVAGLTTAASIWMAAALGMAAAGGAFPLAVVSTIVSVVILRLPHAWLRPRTSQRRGGEASGLFPGQRARTAAETLTGRRPPQRAGRGPARHRVRPPHR